ncbi:hypothetical protein L0Y41_03815 [bacterium]|nr:hypothetical protein [bacterium]
MKIVTVIPFSKTFSKTSASYFTAKDVREGDIVSVPLRSKTVDALVTAVSPAESAKSAIRSSSFNLKKIEGVKTSRLFLPAFIKAAEETADYYAATSGAIFGRMAPHDFFSEFGAIARRNADNTRMASESGEKFILQAGDDDRDAAYRSLIREEFARGKSVLFLKPTISSIADAPEKLGRGIEDYTFDLRSDAPKASIKKKLQKIAEMNHPVLIISTGSFLALPREDIGAIILDEEHSRHYEERARPFIDMRFLAECYARHLGVRYIAGSFLLRIETLARRTKGEFSDLEPPTFRYAPACNYAFVDMKRKAEKNKLENKSEEAIILSKSAHALLERAQERDEQAFLFVSRRGLFPITLCRDCDAIVLCEECGVPVTVHKKKSREGKILLPEEGNFFFCHACGAKRSAAVKCIRCGSWRLVPLGIGAERIAEYVRSAFPRAAVFTLDADTAKTKKQAEKIRDAFYQTPKSILIGTEMSLPYLSRRIPHGIIVSIDSLFAIPEFRMHERIIHFIFSCVSKISENVVVQTRSDEKRLFEDGVKGHFLDFVRDELESREKLGYPPFQTFIKITFKGKADAIERNSKHIAKIFSTYEPRLYSGYMPILGGERVMHALIRIPRENWVDKNLLSLLRELPPLFSVHVNPENVL